jgi:Protein of unknown function (DUF3187)
MGCPRARTLAALLASLLSLAAVPTDDPLPLRSQFPLFFPFLDLPPRAAFLLEAHAYRFETNLAYANTHAMSDHLWDVYTQDDFRTLDGKLTRPVLEATAAETSSQHAYLVDGETMTLTMAGSLGLRRRFEIGFSLPLYLHTGGFLDHTIEEYHDTLSLPDGGRKPFAIDQFVVAYTDHGHTVYLDQSPGGISQGDLLLTGRVGLAASQSGTSALSGTLALELPTGKSSRFDGNGSTDVALGLEASWRRARSTTHAGLRHTFPGGWAEGPGIDLGGRSSAYVSWQHDVFSASRVLLQMLAGVGPFRSRSGGGLGDPGVEIALGMTHRVTSQQTFEWALLENLLPDYFNTPDVGAWMGWRFAPAPSAPHLSAFHRPEAPGLLGSRP